MIKIKTKREIELMREAGRIVALAHKAIEQAIKPGITTNELDAIAEEVIRSNGATPSFKGYGGFPASICASKNEIVVHGIPNDEQLVDGDIVSVDIGACYKGYHGDSAWTYPVGTISKEDELLLQDTETSLMEGLSKIKNGAKLGEVSNAIETYCKAKGYGIVEVFVGHGIGSSLHEEPQIPNYGPKEYGPTLKSGMTLAIEPMINRGSKNVVVLKDGWTTITQDRKRSAHFEHTVLVTDDGYEILTKL